MSDEGAGTPTGLTDEQEEQLSTLRDEHRRLDREIEALQASGANDLSIMTLKRRKLQVKDEIAWLMARITPDIIA